MTKSANIKSIENATHYSWDEWVHYLDANGANELDHSVIAKLAYNKISNSSESAGWWSQSVAVAYEQHIGRRKPGQRADGTYEVSVSKTINGTIDDAMHLWQNAIQGQTTFMDKAATQTPTTSQTEKWRQWRCTLQDGSKLSADTTAKNDSKAILTVSVLKISDQKLVEKWRKFWKEYLSTI